MLYLGPGDLRRVLTPAAAVDSMKEAFGGDREIPDRVLVGPSLFMPGRLGSHTGVKVVSTVPGDPAGIVAVFDADGHPIGLVDGPTLTAIRTGAAAGLATSLLAAEDATVLAMLGAGAMAPDQIASVRAVRSLDRVLVWSRSFERAQNLAEQVGGEPVTDADAAVAEASIITAATPARSPLFRAESVRSGSHINAVGAFTPEMIEIPPEVTRRAFVIVDDLAAARLEAGDVLQAGRDPDGTMGDLLAGRVAPGDQDVTFFKSVGIASQDIAAAVHALETAAELSVGQKL